MKFFILSINSLHTLIRDTLYTSQLLFFSLFLSFSLLLLFVILNVVSSDGFLLVGKSSADFCILLPRSVTVTLSVSQE